MTEDQIVYENGRYWVYDGGTYYNVMRVTTTHSETDSSYRHDADGLSCARVRVDYLARHPK